MSSVNSTCQAIFVSIKKVIFVYVKMFFDEDFKRQNFPSFFKADKKFPIQHSN